MLVCKTSPPTEGTWDTKNRISFPSVHDFTHVTDCFSRREYLVTAEGATGVAKYMRDFYRQEWRVTGKPFRLEKEVFGKMILAPQNHAYMYETDLVMRTDVYIFSSTWLGLPQTLSNILAG